jgi:hypothetical protein
MVGSYATTVNVASTMTIESQASMTGDMDVFLGSGAVAYLGSTTTSSLWSSPTVLTAEVKGTQATVTLRKHAMLQTGKRVWLNTFHAMTHSHIQFVKGDGQMEVNRMTVHGGGSRISTSPATTLSPYAKLIVKRASSGLRHLKLHSNVKVSGAMRIELDLDDAGTDQWVQVSLGDSGRPEHRAGDRGPREGPRVGRRLRAAAQRGAAPRDAHARPHAPPGAGQQGALRPRA